MSLGFRVPDYNLLWLTFPRHSTIRRLFSRYDKTLQPLCGSLRIGLGFSHFARHYFGNILFSSGYLDVSVPRVPFFILFGSYEDDKGSLCRISPFGHPGIDACSRLRRAYRSVPRPSSAFSAKASPVSS